MLKKDGTVRVGAIVPKLKVGNPKFNSNEIINQIRVAAEKEIDIVTTPELAITGYTCGDLFKQEALIEASLDGLHNITEATKDLNIISVVGAPIENENMLFDTAVVIQKGEILAVIPKLCASNYKEAKWFSFTTDNTQIKLFEKEVPFGLNAIEFSNLSFVIEVGGSNSKQYVTDNTKLIFNLAADNELVGKYKRRIEHAKIKSAQYACGYVYCSAGVNESSTDLVFSGHSIIAENGDILVENERFNFESNLIYSDIDIPKLKSDKSKKDFSKIQTKKEYREYPFIPTDKNERDTRCREIISIQSSALAKRLLHTGMKKTVIGLSGGLDSTLAFLVIIEAYKKLGIDNSNILAITMPGFGTTDRTYDNACMLAKNYGATLKEIDIKEACLLHLKDIGLSENDRSAAYENVQARERTQILMDIANKEGALVVGTGDLSELALGWCTYNGDHMSMYSVNAGVPKTLVRCLIEWIANNTKEITLYDILDTPISPELLPPDKYGNITQKTESTIGPYVLHDFFLYHFLRYVRKPSDIYQLAKEIFKENFEKEEIKKWLKVFLKRFFSQQFKRSCIPDGPKIGSVGISPRGDLEMPSDADVEIWINDLENCD